MIGQKRSLRLFAAACERIFKSAVGQAQPAFFIEKSEDNFVHI